VAELIWRVTLTVVVTDPTSKWTLAPPSVRVSAWLGSSDAVTDGRAEFWVDEPDDPPQPTETRARRAEQPTMRAVMKDLGVGMRGDRTDGATVKARGVA
jgi:hypothetical protein